MSLPINDRAVLAKDLAVRTRWLTTHAAGQRAENLGRGCKQFKGRHAWIESPPWTVSMKHNRELRDRELDEEEARRRDTVIVTAPEQFDHAVESQNTTVSDGTRVAVVHMITTATETELSALGRHEKATQTENTTVDVEVQTTKLFFTGSRPHFLALGVEDSLWVPTEQAVLTDPLLLLAFWTLAL